MPYKIVPKDGGEVVVNTDTGRQASSKPLPHKTAVKQFRLLEMVEHGKQPTGKPSNLDT